MRSRIILSCLTIGLIIGIVLFFSSQGPANSALAETANQTAARSLETDALSKALLAYTAAFNKGDLKTLMACWTADPEFIDELGKPTRGQEAIAALFKQTFDDHKGTTLSIKVRSLHLIKPDVAVQDGRVTLTTADGVVEEGLYTSIWVKTDGKWLISRVQDLPMETPVVATNADHLKELEWLIGDWTSEGTEMPVTFTCRWNKSNSFLLIEQTIQLADQESLTLKHIIGWDPAQEQIRSWIFDSRGGFGEGTWTRKGNHWTAESEGVLADGRHGSSSSTWNYIDDRTCEWNSESREIDGRPMPDIKIKYVSKAAKK